jgi:hypothetical protein
MTAVTVTIRDRQGNPVIRSIRLHRLDTGAVLAEGLSNGVTGRVRFEVDFSGEAYAVALDDVGGVVEEMQCRRVRI